MAEAVEVLVIGGGAMGSAAAWQLAERGHDVTLIERFAPGHHHGASHGATRNFNLAYAEDDYVRLVLEARTLWDQLAEKTQTQLLDLVGLVNHGHEALLPPIAERLAAHGVRTEVLSPGAATDRWTGMRFRSSVLHIPESGRVRAADALAALRQAAETAGARFLYETPAVAMEVLGDDRVVVTTERAEFVAQRVVVTAGAWSTDLLGRHLRLPRLVVTQEQPAHFAIRDEHATWPSFNHWPDPDRAEDDYWFSKTYGMLTPGEGVKTGWHGVGPVVHPDRRDYTPEPTQFAALQRYVADWYPGLDPDAFDPISCTYTTTPTEDFVLDRVGPVVVGAGFSGHGFKFTPAIGRVLADLVEGASAPQRFRQLARA